MKNTNKSVIDNWSLEQTAFLLEGNHLETFPSDELFVKALGGLSNFIATILLYEESNFINNGNQISWQRCEWFKNNALIYIKPYIPDDVYLYWMSHMFINMGIDSYLLTSKHLEADLFISPHRAQRVVNLESIKPSNSLLEIFTSIDKSVDNEYQNTWIRNIKLGIEQNFILPSLTQYILSQASNFEDLFTVIIQLKESKKFNNVKHDILELLNTSKTAYIFQNEVENIIKECFGKPIKNDKPWAIKISIMFLTFTKSFRKEDVLEKQYITFLRDLITCRSEAFQLSNDVERIFKRKIDFNNFKV